MHTFTLNQSIPRASNPPAVDLVRQRLDVDIEALLHLVEHLAVSLGGDKGDGQALGAKTPSTTNLVAERQKLRSDAGSEQARCFGGQLASEEAASR